MKPKWWTCGGCEKAQAFRGYGTPVCEGCGALAKFTVQPPKQQGGLDFGDRKIREKAGPPPDGEG